MQLLLEWGLCGLEQESSITHGPRDCVALIVAFPSSGSGGNPLPLEFSTSALSASH